MITLKKKHKNMTLTTIGSKREQMLWSLILCEALTAHGIQSGRLGINRLVGNQSIHKCNDCVNQRTTWHTFKKSFYYIKRYLLKGRQTFLWGYPPGSWSPEWIWPPPAFHGPDKTTWPPRNWPITRTGHLSWGKLPRWRGGGLWLRICKTAWTNISRTNTQASEPLKGKIRIKNIKTTKQ